MVEFAYFTISGDPFGAASRTVTGSGRATFVDPDGTLDPVASGGPAQATIDSLNGNPLNIDITSSAWPGFAQTGAGVEFYTATGPNGPVNFAYFTSAGDTVDDSVDRIVILSGQLNVGDVLSGITLDGPASQNPLPIGNVVCFCSGTLIETPRGEVPVEDLVTGDLATTLDGGVRPIMAILRQTLHAARLARQPELQPIRIPVGALGAGRPSRDLHVSPQHRVLVRGAGVELHFGVEEALVPAKHLASGRRMVQSEVTYHHLVFDRHEIVRSNGAWTESLFAGRAGDQPEQAAELAAIFDGSESEGPSPTRRLARSALKRWEARLLD